MRIGEYFPCSPNYPGIGDFKCLKLIDKVKTVVITVFAALILVLAFPAWKWCIEHYKATPAQLLARPVSPTFKQACQDGTLKVEEFVRELAGDTYDVITNCKGKPISEVQYVFLGDIHHAPDKYSEVRNMNHRMVELLQQPDSTFLVETGNDTPQGALKGMLGMENLPDGRLISWDIRCPSDYYALSSLITNQLCPLGVRMDAGGFEAIRFEATALVSGGDYDISEADFGDFIRRKLQEWEEWKNAWFPRRQQNMIRVLSELPAGNQRVFISAGCDHIVQKANPSLIEPILEPFLQNGVGSQPCNYLILCPKDRFYLPD